MLINYIKIMLTFPDLNSYPKQSKMFKAPINMHSQEYYENIKVNFAQILKECYGVMSAAVKRAGISQETFYRWQREDEFFRKEIAAVRDQVDDFYETEFIKLVKAGNPAAIIYAAKTRLKHRGYGTDVTIQYNNGDMIQLTKQNGDLTEDEQNVIERYVQQRIKQHEEQKLVAMLETPETNLINAKQIEA